MNITNTYKTPQSLLKVISRVCEKFPNWRVIQAISKKLELYIYIHSEKEPSNNVISNETAQFIKNVFKHSNIFYSMPGMKDEITILENGT